MAAMGVTEAAKDILSGGVVFRFSGVSSVAARVPAIAMFLYAREFTVIAAKYVRLLDCTLTTKMSARSLLSFCWHVKLLYRV